MAEYVAIVCHFSCHCACHWDRTKPLISYHGVDVSEPVEAATACSTCQHSHCMALLPTRLANDPEPERREKFEWTDLPPTQADGGEDGG
jgi:hypothetical protein